MYNSSDDPDACKKLLAKVGLEGYQVTNCLIKAFSIATTTCVMSNIDRLTFTFADWQDKSFSESWTNGRLGYPKEYFDVEHRPTHFLEFSNMEDADMAEGDREDIFG